MGRGCVFGKNDMYTCRPDIAQYMFNYNKYYGIINENDPKKISVSGKTEVYGRCDKGHDFHKIANKLSQLKRDENNVLYCPVCLEKGIQKIPYVPRKTYTETFEDYCKREGRLNLLNDWDYDKNLKEFDLTPKDVAPKAQKKVWWKCENGHSYLRRIAHKVLDSEKCPYCSGKILQKGINDLASQYPKIAKEWNYEKNGDLTPDNVFQHSPDKVWWKCDRGHEWQAQISHRTSKRGSSCPICQNHGSSLIEVVLYCCLKEQFENVQHRIKIDKYEYDLYIHDLNLLIEYDGSYYHENGKRDKSDLEKRKEDYAKELGYDFLRIRETNELETNAYFYDGKVNILYIGVGVNVKYVDFCKLLLALLHRKYGCEVSLDIDYSVVVEAREQMGVEKYENSLEYKYPEIAKEWHPTKNGRLKPNDVSFGSHFDAWWVCPIGHEYLKKVYRRTDIREHSKGDCPYCAGQKVLEGYNDLQSQVPGVLKYWDYDRNIIKPNEVTSFSDKQVYWVGEEEKYKISLRVKSYLHWMEAKRKGKLNKKTYKYQFNKD